MRLRKKYGIMMALFFLLATATDAPGADAGSPRNGELYQLSPPRTLPKIAPPPNKPMPAQPTPLPTPILPEHRGALNPKTGEFYPSHGEGVINPKTGEFYPRSGSGYLNPRTGEFFPGKEPRAPNK